MKMKNILTPIGVVALAGTAVAHTLRHHGGKQTLDGGSFKSSFDAMLRHSQKTTNDRVGMSDVNPSQPRSLATGYNCVGNKLMGGSSIGREEYVCSRDGKYRFGLDENGVLGEWHGNELNWSAGFSGSRLYMQNQDGNLVLRDDSGEPLWAIHCGVNPKAFLYAKHGGNGGVRVLSESGKEIIWRTWHSGAESTCFPKNEADPGDFNCVSEMLNADMPALFKDQFICGPDTMYAFGLDKDGMLGEWRNGELHWSPGVSGHRLQMQDGDGNLVLYKEDGTAVWATNCGRFPGAYLRATSPNTFYSAHVGAEVTVGSTIIWKTLNNGDSTCFPGYEEEARCVGSRLDEARRSLGRGEYICSDSGIMFGLNQDGLMGLWTQKSFWNFQVEGTLLWSPGLYGTRLYLQYGDGNLVLRDAQGNPVWASGCTAPLEERFNLVAEYADGVQIMNNDDDIIWKVWSNGVESGCNPSSIEPPETKCKSLSEEGDVLLRNEYVCDYQENVHFSYADNDHRFGLNNVGQLVLWEGRKTIWTAGGLSGGDRVVLNSDSLKVYAADGGIMWTSCPISGGRIRTTPNSVQLVDSGGVAWFIDYQSGVSSTCDPPNVPQYDCPGYVQNGCYINVIDNGNSRNIQMGIQSSIYGYEFDIWGDDGCSAYYYNDMGPGGIIMSGSLDTSSMALTDDTVQYTLAVSCEDLSTKYIMQDDDQFQFVEAASSDCTDFSRSLIYYVIKKNTHSIWETEDRPGQPFVHYVVN